MFHLLTRDNLTCQWVGIVAVHTLEFHWLTIDIVISSSQTELVLTCWCILNLNSTETSLETYRFNNFLSLHQLTNENIDVRRFCCPCCHIVHSECLFNVSLSLTVTNGLCLCILEGCHQLVVISKESVLINAPTKVEILCILCCEVLQCCVKVYSTLAVCIGRDSLHVSNMYFRSSCYADITEDTWQAEHILCLEETTV